MAPPSFVDINKTVKDLFNKGYTHGFVKFDSTTKAGTCGNVEFQTSASHNLTSQKLGGNFSVKYRAPQYGLTLTEKWTTENVLGTVIEANNSFAKGLKVILDTTYVPHSAKRGGVLKTEWTNDAFKVNTALCLQDGPTLMVSGVTTHQGWILGAQTKFDVSSNEIKGTSVAAAFQTPEYTVHSYTNDGREFGASIFHKAHRDVELGAQLSWMVGDQSARFGLATKYRANNDVTVRAKLDNNAQMALAATHDLTPSVKLTLSTQFSLLNNDAQNKLGFGVEYSPK